MEINEQDQKDGIEWNLDERIGMKRLIKLDWKNGIGVGRMGLNRQRFRIELKDKGMKELEE